MFPRSSIFAAFLLASLWSPVAAAAECAVDDGYGTILAKARDQWPDSRPFFLESDEVVGFLIGYNDQPDHGDDVRADTIVVFPLEAATWYFIAFERGCMTFWVDLTDSKAYHLIELGHALSRKS